VHVGRDIARNEAKSAFVAMSDLTSLMSDLTSPSSARIWRKSSRMRLAGSSVIE
jgi:hypothetical protein